jgi:hypothetical protein
MTRQSKNDRLKRLKEGCCPIHGICMSQIGLEEILLSCGHYKTGRFIVGCGRKDCDIKAYEEEAFKDAVLLPEFEYLLDENNK